MSAGGGYLRPALEAFIEAAIDLLDALDAPEADREPDADAEICSEDDAALPDLRQVGRQWGSAA